MKNTTDSITGLPKVQVRAGGTLWTSGRGQRSQSKIYFVVQSITIWGWLNSKIELNWIYNQIQLDFKA